uniref:DUF1618 domain-containing protein n=1 Tax=Aegilops tauschii TaxID=37682 RepID=M8AKX1_AEGTA
MWAWRSFLGYTSNSNSNGDLLAEANQQHRAAAAKRHLYVVLDDHSDGHGIHKLDLANDDDLDGSTGRLLEPPVLRVALPTVRDDVQFAAVGSSIVAISTSITRDMEWQEVGVGGVLIYDTKTAAQGLSGYIRAHAVQPLLGGATHDHEIFVSAWDVNNDTYKTFSFSTTTHEWTWRGDWRLPVVGHAHYDSELDAWLGLLDDGHLRLGNVSSAPDEWKDSKETLFCLDEDTAAGWSHVDVKLVPMASHEGGSEYYLMERLRPAGNDEKKCLENGGTCLLRLTSFCVERDEHGEPVAMASRRARSYSVSRYNKYFKAQAFWM